MQSGAGATCESDRRLFQRQGQQGGRPVFTFTVLELRVRFSARGAAGIENVGSMCFLLYRTA